jgi:hypothetical protein
MTLMMYVGAPMMLGKPMDVAGMLAAFLGTSWTMGFLMHGLNGVVIFPLIYAFGLHAVLPGAPWSKGTLWGLILWFVSQVLVMPMMGAGFFSARAGGLVAVMASLVAHVIYGALLGWIAAETPVPARQEPQLG